MSKSSPSPDQRRREIVFYRWVIVGLVLLPPLGLIALIAIASVLFWIDGGPK